MLWVGQTVSLHCNFGFLFLPLGLCLLLGFLSSFILTLIVLTLQLLLDLLFLFSQVSTHLEHLLIRLVHLHQVISRPLIGNLHYLKLLEHLLGILEGHFVRVDLFGSLVELLA